MATNTPSEQPHAANEGVKVDPDVEMVEHYDVKIDNSNAGPEIDRKIERRIVRKIDIRILPITAFIYLLCYLDRSNIGNARILNESTGDSMMETNDMTAYQFTIALMVFLVAYSVFEAPSNLALKVLHPHRWLGFLVIAFGALCAGIAGTHNFAGVTALRFFLGAAEAGVFPGMIFYLSFWYKPDERAARIAVFMCSATLSGAFGGAIAYAVGHMNMAAGLEGWRWLFIIEGAPTVAFGVFVFFFLPSYPNEASWLTADEKDVEIRRLGTTASTREDKLNWKDVKETLTDWRLYFHYITYTCVSPLISSLSLFAPVIVAGMGYQDLDAQLFTVPPYAVSYVLTLLFAWLSDRYRNRGLIAAASLTLAGITFLVQAALPTTSYATRYAMLVFATTGAFGALPPLNAWVGDNVRNTTARSLSIALNIAFSGPGQIIGVWIYRAQDKPFYSLGNGVNAAMAFVAAALSLGLSLYYRRLNRRLQPGEEPWMT